MNKKIINKINVKTILIDFLKQHNYDGLLNADLECGCAIDDLIPCDFNFSECEPAYKLECPCENEGEHEACEYKDWCMGNVKPKKNKQLRKKINKHMKK